MYSRWINGDLNRQKIVVKIIITESVYVPIDKTVELMTPVQIYIS
ncbi:hypothetical protein [Clostridioides difficile]|nr:hypothetical protein [Clostridioides difficile]MDM0193132.1 hypothetical protein [Clostridioides difficile]